MSNNELKYWINLLNRNKFHNSIFIKQIGDNVFFGYAWDKRQDGSQSLDNKHNVYFIRKEENFVGCVYYGGSDIHIYTIPKYRRQGLMKRSLKDIILPHIFVNFNKDKQRATSNIPNAIKLLLQIGFVSKENYFEIKKDDLPEYIGMSSRNVLNQLTLERANLLKQKIEKAIVEIAKVRDELSINFYENTRLTKLINENYSVPRIPIDMFVENEGWAD